MRKCAVLIFPFLFCAQATIPAVTPAPLSGKLGEAVKLFNGKDLEGWVWFQRPPKAGATQPALVKLQDVWTVRDGILHDQGKPIGYLRTEKEYDNYVLTVEQRHVQKGNGGILFGIGGADKVWPHCLEVQDQNGEEGDIRNPAEYKVVSDLARTEAKRIKRIGGTTDPEKPAGEWEIVEIIVDHGNLTVKLNGVVQNVANYSGPLNGKIGLQAEGGEMEFRKIELCPIE